MPPLIRLDTSVATLTRAPSVRSPDRSARESNAPSSPNSPLSRLHRSISQTVSPIVGPLRRKSTRRKANVDHARSPRSAFPSVAERDEEERVTPPQRVPPIVKFRDAAQQIIRMNRMKSILASSNDPGLESRRSTMYNMYGAVKEHCTIDVVDFGPEMATKVRLDNDSLEDFLQERKRPSHARVRWINVTSISWDVISTLAHHCDLHPLAVEDVFGGESNMRTKSDYYLQHLFIRLLCHIPRPDCDPSSQGEPLTSHGPDETATEEAEDIELEDVGIYQGHEKYPGAIRSLAGASLSGAQPWAGACDQSWAGDVLPFLPPTSRRATILAHLKQLSLEKEARAAEEALMEELKKGQRVQVDKRNMYIFLLRDSTVISIHPTAYDTFFEPIMRRISQGDSMLRMKANGSLLLHALINQVVDYAYSMVDRFHTQALDFESQVLVNPAVNIIRDIHIASADLKSHTATLKPILLMVRSLRVNDKARCVALTEDEGYALKNKDHIRGYMSMETSVYLADMEDHIRHIIRALDTYADTEELLLEYIFNFARLSMASYVRIYTTLMVIVLPAIIIAMYFGMNFKPMAATDQYTDLLYWQVALPTLGGIALVLTWRPLSEWYQEFQKKSTFKRFKRVPTKSV